MDDEILKNYTLAAQRLSKIQKKADTTDVVDAITPFLTFVPTLGLSYLFQAIGGAYDKFVGKRANFVASVKDCLNQLRSTVTTDEEFVVWNNYVNPIIRDISTNLAILTRLNISNVKDAQVLNVQKAKVTDAIKAIDRIRAQLSVVASDDFQHRARTVGEGLSDTALRYLTFRGSSVQRAKGAAEKALGQTAETVDGLQALNKQIIEAESKVAAAKADPNSQG